MRYLECERMKNFAYIFFMYDKKAQENFICIFEKSFDYFQGGKKLIWVPCELIFNVFDIYIKYKIVEFKLNLRRHDYP